MKAFLLTLLHLTVMTATLCGPGPAPMPATGTTRGNLRGFWGRGSRFGRGGGIARGGPAVSLTSGGVGARRPTLIAG